MIFADRALRTRKCGACSKTLLPKEVCIAVPRRAVSGYESYHIDCVKNVIELAVQMVWDGITDNAKENICTQK